MIPTGLEDLSSPFFANEMENPKHDAIRIQKTNGVMENPCG